MSFYNNSNDVGGFQIPHDDNGDGSRAYNDGPQYGGGGYGGNSGGGGGGGYGNPGGFGFPDGPPPNYQSSNNGP
ncbi:hypothetical protein LPJ75_007227, partial [Coemansia sp. RSA 2598]